MTSVEHFFPACLRLTNKLGDLLGNLHKEGHRGYFDLRYFYPSAPLHEESFVRVSVVAVDEEDEILHGWSRIRLTEQAWDIVQFYSGNRC